MARKRRQHDFDPNESPTAKAYNWGRRGVDVTTTLLTNWLGFHTENHLMLRASNLQRRVYGAGAHTHHMSAILLGVGVFLIALFVDYNIIHEFWTRALANEFMEVPPALATSVAFKSLQVLFATLAVHYLITHIGHGGRVAYSLFIFALTAIMVMGIGMLWANNSLPEGAKIFGTDVNQSAQSIDSFAQSLGIQTPAHAPAAAAAPADLAWLKQYQGVIWLFSLGVIFLVVASIGAMSLHTAMRGFAGMTGGALYDTHHEANMGNQVRDELSAAKLDLAHLRKNSEKFKKAKLSEFISYYTEGVLAGNMGSYRTKSLLKSASEAANAVDNSFSFEDAEGEEGKENVDNLDNYRRRAAHG